MGQYHDLYGQSNVVLLPDVSKNFKTMCLIKYEFDSPKFLPAPGLAWQSAFKKD